jgi:hypothetical protein
LRDDHRCVVKVVASTAKTVIPFHSRHSRCLQTPRHRTRRDRAASACRPVRDRWNSAETSNSLSVVRQSEYRTFGQSETTASPGRRQSRCRDPMNVELDAAKRRVQLILTDDVASLLAAR